MLIETKFSVGEKVRFDHYSNWGQWKEETIATVIRVSVLAAFYIDASPTIDIRYLIQFSESEVPYLMGECDLRKY